MNRCTRSHAVRRTNNIHTGKLNDSNSHPTRGFHSNSKFLHVSHNVVARKFPSRSSSSSCALYSTATVSAGVACANFLICKSHGMPSGKLIRVPVGSARAAVPDHNNDTSSNSTTISSAQLREASNHRLCQRKTQHAY